MPYIGPVKDIPSDRSWLQFSDWAKEFGPIYQVQIMGDTHIWISSERIASDLLSKRGAIYSDRPNIPNVADSKTSGKYMALMGNNGKRFQFSNLIIILNRIPTNIRNQKSGVNNESWHIRW